MRVLACAVIGEKRLTDVQHQQPIIVERVERTQIAQCKRVVRVGIFAAQRQLSECADTFVGICRKGISTIYGQVLRQCAPFLFGRKGDWLSAYLRYGQKIPCHRGYYSTYW